AAIQSISTMPLGEMGLKGREWMRTEFNWDSVAHKMVGVYRDLLSRPSKPSRRSEEHTSELQSRGHLVCRLLLGKKVSSCLCGHIAQSVICCQPFALKLF